MIHRLMLKSINIFYNLSNTKLIILGNQKSGTTAIAKLISLQTGKKNLLDTPLLWQPNLSKIINQKIKLSSIIESNKYYFGRPIIKEPNLTFFYEQLRSIYPSHVKYIFIVRDPRDNIRSLLNRIKVPGNLDNIDSYFNNFSIHEQALFDNEILPYESEHYIEKLAEKWIFAVRVYFRSTNDFHLARYEDFIKDKTSYITNLTKKIGLEPKYDISSKIDTQFQPKGNNELSWLEFFGKKNLQRVNLICEKYLRKLDYPIK